MATQVLSDTSHESFGQSGTAKGPYRNADGTSVLFVQTAGHWYVYHKSGGSWTQKNLVLISTSRIDLARQGSSDIWWMGPQQSNQGYVARVAYSGSDTYSVATLNSSGSNPGQWLCWDGSYAHMGYQPASPNIRYIKAHQWNGSAIVGSGADTGFQSPSSGWNATVATCLAFGAGSGVLWVLSNPGGAGQKWQRFTTDGTTSYTLTNDWATPGTPGGWDRVDRVAGIVLDSSQFALFAVQDRYNDGEGGTSNGKVAVNVWSGSSWSGWTALYSAADNNDYVTGLAPFFHSSSLYGCVFLKGAVTAQYPAYVVRRNGSWESAVTFDSSQAAGGLVGDVVTCNGDTANQPKTLSVAWWKVSVGVYEASVVLNSNPNPPSIDSGTPASPNAYDKATAKTLYATATDPDGDAVQYEWDYSANDGSSWTNIGISGAVASGTQGTLAWNTAGLASGTGYRLRVRSKDADSYSGYTTQGASFTLTAAPAAPAIDAPTPTGPGAYDKAPAKTLNATASDGDGDQVQYEWDYSANAGGSWTSIGTSALVSSGSQGTLAWDTSGLASGTDYRLRVRAKDAHGIAGPYTTQASSFTLTAAPAAPTITSPVASGAYDRAVTLAATATDPEGGSWYATFEYQVDGGAWTPIGDGSTVASGASSTRAWDTSRLVPVSGNYKVRAKATDNHGIASGFTTMASPFTIHRPEFLALLAF